MILAHVELFVVGLLLSACSETPFDTYLELWSHSLDHDWRLTASWYGWHHNTFCWGDPNTP